MSPYYPNNYQPQMQCLYKFIALPSERVKVDFDDFVLQGNPAERCHEDYVDIYAELQQPEIRLEDAETTISGRYCGRIAPRTRISLYNIIIVGFYSNDNVQERGFNASYHFMKDERYHVGEKAPGTICDQTITAAAYSEGQILSPTYPGAYPNNLHCTYSLEGNPLQRIQLIFDDFDLYYGGPHCPYDWLKVHDGRSTDAPLINTMLCGYKHRGKVIFSTKENLFLEFHSSKAPDSENLGFNIHFKFSSEFVSLNFLGLPEYHVRGTECDQRIPSRGISNGTIISPNYPRKYMPGRVCKYLVDGLNDDQNLEKVNLVFREFNIPRDAYGKCNDGYVAFYLNGDDTEGMPNHQWCGNYTFHPVISKGPRLLMVLHSGNSSGWGFKAQYSFLTDYGIPGTLCSQNDVTEGSPQQCCFTYSGKSQELTGAFVSPRHPHKYPSITDCIYNFVASPNQLIRIRFVKFDLASEDPPPGVYPHGTEYCQDDWVEIYQIWSDSPKDREMRVGRYCKSLTPGPWISEPGVSRLKVLFHSNKDHQAQGFSAVYTFVKGKAKVADSKTSAQALTYERETIETIELEIEDF
ncbi:PREDICTED: tolloid-like protein 1 [Priapulus caudatus]|uniref:Tolloid-like protein 1 n=1 Tax=Priapulus caudatus TaxID=37621 RepID=A0ABM1DZH4_PRICU|nr:PREDICTED: tolloid-like protein 1 [Priapulus caudatus]